MRIDWKIWNYKGRKVALAHFFLFAFMAGLLIWEFYSERNVATVWEVVFAVVFIIVACFRGYRAFFFSDDWFHAKEARSADWWDKHLHLRNAYSTTGWIVYFLIIACLLWTTYRK